MRDAFAVELLKARRSRLPWLTAATFSIVTLVGALFMFILQDSARARSMGLLGTKAELAGGTADWPGYLSFLAQATAVGGTVIYGVVLIWIFGREFSDHTVKDLLALPTPRTTIVAAKFLVTGLWSLGLAVEMFVLGLAAGSVLRLASWSLGAAEHGLARLLITAVLAWVVATVLAFAASVGRGYLAAVGVLFAMVFAAQIVAALGFGHLFPFSVPAVFSGLAGADRPAVGPLGFVLLAVVGAAGIGATLLWWRNADQSG